MVMMLDVMLEGVTGMVMMLDVILEGVTAIEHGPPSETGATFSDADGCQAAHPSR